MTASPRTGSGHAMRRRWPLCFAALMVGSVLLILLGVVQMLSGQSFVPGLLMGPLWLGLLSLALVAYLMWRSRIEPNARTTPSQPVESEQRFRSLLESLPRVAVQGYDRQRRVIYWNKASELLYGYSADEAIGRYLEDLLIPGVLRKSVIAAHHDWIEKGLGIPAGELELRQKSGVPIRVFSYHLMLGERTDNPLMFCVDVDLRERTQARCEFELVTGFDTLSHLPDRPTFEAELATCMADCQRLDGSLAVIGIGVEPLGEIVRDATETCAEEDALMAMVASRLRQDRPENPVARFGNAGFVMVLPNLQSDDEVLPLLESIFEDIGQPYALAERALGIATSIGVSLFPDNGTSAGELIHTADMAMQRARLAGPDSYWFFDQSLHDELTRQYQLMQQLSHDLRDGEYVLRYQPRMTTASERIEGLEACLHFSSQAGAALPPIDFNLADDERSDLVHRLGDWVMREACRQQSQCKVTAPQGYCITINSSGGQITQETMFEPLAAYMYDSRLPAQVDRHRAGRASIQRHGREYAIRLEAALASQRDERA